jgi:hypothetical protein
MEIKQHAAELEMLTAARAPDLIKAHGMTTGAAAEMLLLVVNNRDASASRRHSLSCAASAAPQHRAARPIGNRLNGRGGRQANAALYRVVFSRDHSPPQALLGPRDLQLSLHAD